jgi:hypothetical protein
MNAATALALALLGPAQPPADPAPVNVKECVSKGLKWLSEQQELEGNWFGRANSAPVTTTAMAGLALLMEGSTLKTGTHAPHLRKAVAWMETVAAENGALVGKNRTDAARPFNTHAHALLFLACAYDVDDDPVRHERVRGILERAVTYATNTQSARGGWGLTAAPKAPDDTLTTITMLQALTTAREAGIEVPKRTITSTIDHLVKATTSAGAVFRFSTNEQVVGARVVHLTAGATAVVLMHDGPRPAALLRWVRHLHTLKLPTWPTNATANDTSMAAQLNLARLTFALGENGHRALERNHGLTDPITWSGFRAGTFRSIKETQAADGSWPNTQPGPVYGSAVALIILQMENDFLPAFSR